MFEMKSLDEAMNYQNPQVIRMLARKTGISTEEAEQIFQELKKFLWFLAQRAEDANPFPMFPEQSIIDAAWHEFILSTKDYHFFCSEFLGRYIHHIPTPDGTTEDERNFGVSASLHAEDPSNYIEAKVGLLRQSMLEVANCLGVETMRRWYETFPEKYFFQSNKSL